MHISLFYLPRSTRFTGAGLDKATAQKILKLWDDAGAKSPDALRKMLVNRSLQAVGVAALQTLLDAGNKMSICMSTGPLGNASFAWTKAVASLRYSKTTMRMP